MRRSAAALAVALLALGTAVVAPSRPAAAASAKVFLLGDSVMAGLNFSSDARALLASSYDVTLDAKVCRTLHEPSCSTRFDGQPPAALSVMRANAGGLGDVLVMMVGYNDSGIAAGVDDVMAEAASQRVPHVLWLTYRNPAGRYTASNATLRAKAQQYPTLAVGDWDAFAAGQNGWFGGDGLHLTGAGALGLATFIKTNVDTLLGGGSSASAPGAARGSRCGGDVSGTATATGAATPRAAPASGFVAVTPTRVADTRAGAPLGAGRSLDVDLSALVPTGASAALVNVTAVDACDTGFLTAYACGSDAPLASNVNYGRGATRANVALVVLGQDRHLCVFTYATADVLVDLAGWFAPGQGWRYQPLDPSRLVDTRDAFRAASPVTGQRPAGSTLPVTVTPWPEAPGSPAAVLVNVTAVGAHGPGFVTVSACGVTPSVSTLNVQSGAAVANLAASAVAGDGTICVYTSTAMHIVVDVEGWFGATGSLLAPQTPQRIVDTRSGLADGRLGAGATLSVPSATGAVINVTATGAAAPGFVTVRPCGSVPWVSNANYAAGESVPALAAVGTSAGGFCVTSLAATDVVIDRLASLV